MTDTPDTRPRPGGTYRLGTHTVARVGFGAMQLEEHRIDRPRAISLLRRAVELGVNHVDTAHFYGNGFANSVIREVLHDTRDLIVVSKIGADPDPEGTIPIRPAQRPEQLRKSLEDNLVDFGLEQIPIVNLRRLDVGPGFAATGDQIVDLDDQLDVMIALRAEGKIGAFGVSAVDLSHLRRALPAGIACVQNAYSLVAREFEEMLELCLAEAIAWVPFFPLGSAFPGLPKVIEQPLVVETAERLDATPSQIGLAWLLAHAPNTLLIAGTSNLAHLEQNVAAASVTLDPSALAALDALAIPGVPGPKWPPEDPG